MRSFEDSGKRLIKRLAIAVLVCAIAPSVSAATKTHISPQQADKAAQPVAVAQESQNCEDIELLRKNLQKLKADVRQLRKKVTEIEKDRQVNVLRDVLAREELRAETLQARLRETLERQVGLQIRMEQVDQQLRPENIERIFVGVGMVRPEEARETVRRRLSVEKQGIQAQLELLRQERARLQASLASADAAIQRLRFRLSDAARP